MIIPVSEDNFDYARLVQKNIPQQYMINVDLSENTLNKKIREAEVYKYNYILVVGKKESLCDSVNVRTKNQILGLMTVDSFISHLQCSIPDCVK